MDPNANLAEQREIAARILAYGQYPTDLEEDAARLADLVEALDGWLASGGAVPDRWLR